MNFGSNIEPLKTILAKFNLLFFKVGGLGILKFSFFDVTRAMGGWGVLLSLVQYVLGYD